MTAEIAIMNKTAVALAADSAVTITNSRNQKIYNSINKLFTLSKYRPVGIMIYGSGQLMGVPWESIIKIYRGRLGKRQYATLKEYSRDFVEYLDGKNSLFPESEQKKYFSGLTMGYLRQIVKEMDTEVKSTIAKEAKIRTDQVKAIASKTIQKHATKLGKLNYLPSFTNADVAVLLDKYRNDLDDIIKKTFQEVPLQKDDIQRIDSIVAAVFLKDRAPRGQRTGVVVSGFGEEDVYPSIVEYQIDGVINNKLQYKEKSYGSTGLDNKATIVPFAQSEMVHTFIEGVDPFMKAIEDGYLTELFRKLPEHLLASMETCADEEKKIIKDKITKACTGILADFKKSVDDYRRQNHVQPILDAVAFLPKDELAAMAESLVNLTSFKKKISLDAETVGGPIDVAIISKGDGFVWIKRKHYFNSDVNPYFYANYFEDDTIVVRRSVENDEEEKGTEK